MMMGLKAYCYYAEAIERRSTIYIYVPESLEDNSQPAPVCYLLHGAHGSELDWWQQGQAPKTLESLISDEGLPPMILAMPSDGDYYLGTGYVNWFDGTGRFADALVRDAVGFVDGNFPTLSNGVRYATGFSMGGYGAIHLGLSHPGLFSSVTSLSGYFSPETMLAFFPEYYQRIYGPRDGEYARRYDPMWQISGMDSLPFRLMLDCGVEDQLIEANRRFHTLLAERRIEHIYLERPGAHNWDYVSQHLGDSFRFHAKNSPESGVRSPESKAKC
jgi:S-formylglutathione hydrolase FrmB